MESWAGQLEAGDPEAAWDLFIERYRRLIFGVIHRYAADRDDVMDVFATVCAALRADDFARLRRCAAQLQPDRPISTWLVVVIRNLAIDWLRHRDGRRGTGKVADSLTPLQARIFEHVFIAGCSHVEAYELIRSQHAPDLGFSEYLGDLAATYRATASWRSHLAPELAAFPPVGQR